MTLFPSPAIADPMQELESARQMLSTYGQQLAEVQTRLAQNTEKLNVIESDIVARRTEADQTNLQLTDAQDIGKSQDHSAEGAVDSHYVHSRFLSLKNVIISRDRGSERILPFRVGHMLHGHDLYAVGRAADSYIVP